MVEETIPKPDGALDVDALWYEAETPDARRAIMDQIAALGFTDAALHAHQRMRKLIGGIADLAERSMTAHDYVVTTAKAAGAIVYAGGRDLLLEEARAACKRTFFDTPLALLGAYVHVVAVSREKRELTRIRDLVAGMPQTDTGPNVRAWCWRELLDATNDVCDAERYVNAGGKWSDLGFKDIDDARVRIAERRRITTPAAAAAG